MKRKRILWQLFPSYLLIAFVPLVLIGWYISGSLHKFYINQLESELEIRAKFAQTSIKMNIAPLHKNKINEICRFYSHLSSTRYTFVLPSGKVVGDSLESPEKMENHSKRPEIVQALHGHVGRIIRYSSTFRGDMMYLAIPVFNGSNVVGVIRTAFPLCFIDEILDVVYMKIALVSFIIAIFVAILSYTMSRRISDPLENLENGIMHFTNGNLKYELPLSDIKEIAGLASTMNVMAAQLDDRINAIEQKKNEQEAMFENMAEGVIAVDEDENLIDINRTAAKLLGLDFSVIGSKIDDVFKNEELLGFIKDTLRNQNPIENYITLKNDQEYCLNVHGTQVKYAREHNIKAIVVLNDITRLRHLENVRRDFVANVSHELKTPITSIKGFVETLLDGMVDDREDAQRFLGIILKHVNRLTAIIEDLLSLSRLEKGKEEAILEKGLIEDVIKSAIQVCELKATSKNVELVYYCPENLYAAMNSLLLEQAIVNLVNNAINYSPESSKVEIEASLDGKQAVIKVKDQGCGIPEEDLSRIFERFYRVDKARSRKLGGTGLGLAIVKHIVQVHGGNINVQSKVNEGSTFSIHIPLEK